MKDSSPEYHDLVLVNTPVETGANIMRLGLLTIASYAAQKGYSVTILDGPIASIKQQIERLKTSDKTVIGFTATTDVAEIAYDLCSCARTKHPASLLVIGGNHVTAIPEQTLKESKFDLAVLGEGEHTAVEILDAMKAGRNPKDVPGVAWIENGSMVKAQARPLIENLDDLPFPAYEMVNIEHCLGFIRTGDTRTRRCLYMLITRGCPFDCTFCGSKTVWQRCLRWHSADYAVKLIQQMESKYAIDSIALLDDELAANRSKLTALTGRMIETGLAKRLKWECHASVNSFNSEIATILKAAGCVSVRFGFESGCQATLDFLKNRKMKIEDAHAAVKACRDAGLGCFGSFIIGSPDESLDDILETIAFIENSRLEGAAIFTATPYPGTDLYRIALEQDLLEHPHPAWSRFVVEGPSYRGPILKNNHFTAAQLGLIREYINNQICNPLNIGARPANLDHRTELKKIIAGDIRMTRPSLQYKLQCILTMVRKAILHPNRIPGYVGRRLKRALFHSPCG